MEIWKEAALNLSYGWIRNEDVRAWAELTNLLAVVDASEEFYESEDLLEELQEPGVDPENDTVAVWDGDKFIAFGQLRVGQDLRDGLCRIVVDGGVHPEYRRRGIGTRLMDLLEARGAHKAASLHPGALAAIDIWGHALGHSCGIMAVARGYQPARYFQDMAVTGAGFRDGTDTSDPGDSVRSVAYSSEWAEAVRVLDNEAFSDHWGSTPKTVEEWKSMTSARSFRAERSRILIAKGPEDGNGTVVSYVLASEWTPGELYVARVGTARDSRGKGFAAGLLSEVVRSSLEAGFAKVELTVDADSPAGAVGLYERLGFALTRTGTMYRKTVPRSPIAT